MKSAPASLIAKLQQNIQVESTDAVPHLTVIAKQTTYNSLLSEVIHSQAENTRGDVAIRQLEGEKSPSLAYAICIDNGIAKLYDRELPTTKDKPWNYVFDVAKAEECAIEFNGIWKLESRSKDYFLQTELTPYIFYVQSGNLYVQQWNDETTRVPLAEGVSEISVCRGWQSSYDLHLDQGLIIGYLKSGKAYYRSLCFEQESQSLMWEGETEITQLGNGLQSINTFRTNDFRIGFIAETATGFKYVISKRNYAGQSVRPESAYVEVNSNARCSMVPMNRQTLAFSEVGTLITSTPDCEYYLGFCMEYPAVQWTGQRLSKTHFRLTASHVLRPKKDITKYIGIAVKNLMPIAVNTEIGENTIDVYSDTPIPLSREVTITLSGRHMLLFLTSQATPLLVQDFTVVIPEDPINVFTDDKYTQNYSVEQQLRTIHIIRIEKDTRSESALLKTNCTSSITMTLVGTVPI